jgi:AcrR family transcriptional regulator
MRADARRNAEQVMAGARRAVASTGLDVSYHEIARRAGVGVGTVYRRYPDRAQLVEAVMLDILGELLTQAERALASDDPWTGFAGFFTTLTLRFRENAGLSDTLPDRGGPSVAAARLRLLELIERLVNRAQRAGSLRDDIHWEDIPLLAASIPASGRCVLNLRADSDQAERCVAILIDGMKSST